MGVILLKKLQGFLVLTTITMMALLYHLPDISLSSRLKSQRTRNAKGTGQQYTATLTNGSLTTGGFKIDHVRVDVPATKIQPVKAESDTVLYGRMMTNDTSQHNNSIGPKSNGTQVDSAKRRNGDDISVRRNKIQWISTSFQNGTKTTNGKCCDSECRELLTLFRNWPTDRPRAAFYYLTQLSRLNLLIESLFSLDTYFNNRFRYPVIIFHEGDLNDHMSYIRERTKSQVIFQLVHFSIPDFLTRPVPRDIPCISHVSYRHMCRFHARNVYEEPTIMTLQYYWRLDDDSLLLSNVSYDVFEFMQRHSLQYGYLWRHWDSLTCVEGLWEATERYIAESGLKSEFFSSWKRGYLYYNNFEISSTKMWLSDKYKLYIDYIDRLGGIFYNRWGDAPLHGIAVSMFVPKNQTYLFHDIGYRHGSYRHEPHRK